MRDPKESSRSRRGTLARLAAGAALLAALPLVIAARPDPTPQADGQAVYRQTCSACHQPTGAGVPGAFPPLAGSEWVNGDKLVVERGGTINGQTVSAKQLLSLNSDRSELTVERTVIVQHGYTLKGTPNYATVTDVFSKVR